MRGIIIDMSKSPATAQFMTPNPTEMLGVGEVLKALMEVTVPLVVAVAQSEREAKEEKDAKQAKEGAQPNG